MIRDANKQTDRQTGRQAGRQAGRRAEAEATNMHVSKCTYIHTVDSSVSPFYSLHFYYVCTYER